MTEDIEVDSEQLDTENPLSFSQLEGLSYEKLPQKLLLDYPGLMTTLRLMSSRTQHERITTGVGREWSCWQMRIS